MEVVPVAAFVNVLVQNLIELSKREFSQIRGLEKEVQKLNLNLLTIQQFLNGAETQTISNEAVKIWLKRLENAAFEADEVLDALHYHAAFPKELKINIKKKEKVLISCFSPSIDNARNRNMAVSIKEINKDLKSINKMATALGLQKILADAPAVPYAGMETDAFSADPIFIGRDEVVAEIVETLITSVATHHERVFSILPIVGMGGLGKTTLTRNVFHHQKMETQFRSHRIWVHVSQVFDPINLFKKILLELTSSQSGDGEISRQVILKRLQEALKDKKYLLVLDDVWNEDASKWEDFLNSLLGVTTTKGNGIIVTTRNTEVAKIVRPIRIHQLKGLSEEDCWSIIRAKSFGNDGVPSDVESVGREIAKRCGGLPLAASVLGGVLRRDKSVDEWRSISQNWLSSEGEGDNNITKILRLSFNNLSSPSLKKCFSYCSIFPKGERLERQKLIEMWMGEGFLGSNEDMESVGDKFYNVLLHSSLLQVYYGEAQKLRLNLLTIQQFLNDAETQTITSGAVKIWLKRLENAAFEADNVLGELHYHALSKTIKKKKFKVISPFFREINMNLDSINESATKLGLREKLADAPTVPDAGMETDSFSADPIFIGRDDLVSANQDWCVMHDLVHDLASSVLGNADGVSRVRYLFHKQGKSSPIKKEVAQHLRTLIFQADQPFDDNIFSDFKSLHVLILKGRSFQELPRSIRKLIHLRNLTISVRRITHLPDWIGELHHLQTLRAERLMKLPSTIKYLINLRHLHVDRSAELPAEIGRLTSLQTLWREFIVRDKNGYKIEELGSLNNLKGSLMIECLEKVHDKEEAEKANLSKKSKLSKLCLAWTSNRSEEVERINDENVLEGLQPHSNMKKLEIQGFNGKSFPEWTLKMAVRNEPQGCWVGLNQLVEIEFNRCTKCEEIPMLGHLPKLKSLCLGGLSNVKSFYGIGNETGVFFPVLETLKLCDMDSLKEWAEVESGSTSEVKVFPNLQSLKISNCNQLIKAPTHFSSCLKSLHISGCNQLTTDCYLSLLSKLTSLRDLVLEGLESLPVELFNNNPNLFVLKISKCPKLREIPFGRRTAYFLKELIIEECPDLKRIGLMDYPFEIGGFRRLTKLGMKECHGLMDFPYEILKSRYLKQVALEGLSSLSNLPRLIECLAKSTARLMELRIVGVPKFLATSVDQVWHFPYLERLVIDVSMEGSTDTSVATMDRILQGCSRNHLRQLYLTGMESWECLPESIQHLTSLAKLELRNFGMEEIPEWFDQYISRTGSRFQLILTKCERLKRLPSSEAMQRLIEQKRVDITGCPKLQQQSDDGSE